MPFKAGCEPMCEMGDSSHGEILDSNWLRLWMSIAVVLTFSALTFADDRNPKSQVDPADWGDDHIGRPLESYITGDECLFCHRTIGPTWLDNPHQLAIRPATPEEPAIARLRQITNGNQMADETRYLLGTRQMTRYLRRSKEFGKLEMLSTSFVPNGMNPAGGKQTKDGAHHGELINDENPVWDTKTFGDRCAGCHATAVNTETRAFSALSIDCVACHGDVDLGHTKGTMAVLLSTKEKDARQIISLCGQCHLRGGKSRSSGLPYPNSFVAGDNLFRDFQVDFSESAIEALPAIDEHIYRVAREVAVFDDSTMTCLTCHNVHQADGTKHQQLENSMICAVCHVAETSNAKLRDELLRENRQARHSRVCDY